MPLSRSGIPQSHHSPDFVPCNNGPRKTEPPSRHLKELVGTARFELATPCTPSKCATRLRYVPILPIEVLTAGEIRCEDDNVGSTSKFNFQILH